MASPSGVSRLPRRQTLKLPRKPSARDLNTSSRPLGGPPQADASTEPSTVLASSSSTSPKDSPGRGLTLQIDDNKLAVPHPIQSAPARSIRRLPSIPLHCPGPTTAFPSSTPFSTAAQFSDIPPLPSRAKRPLPCPPPPPKDVPQIPQLPIIYESPAPTTRPVVKRKPLPAPLEKIDPISPLLLHPPLAAILAPQAFSQPPASLPSIPRPNSPPAILHADKKPYELPSTPKKADTVRSKVDTKRDERDAVLLHRQLVLDRAACLSVDSDHTSEDDFDDDASSGPMLFARFSYARPAAATHEDAVPGIEKELHADYAWVLSNRILYQQNPSEGRGMMTSKWVREKKGKRYTEQDFDNVLKALRTL